MSTQGAGPSQSRREFVLRHRLYLSAWLHGASFVVALFAAFLLAYNFKLKQSVAGGLTYSWLSEFFPYMLALALPLKLIVFWVTGQYHLSWRYVGLRDLFSIIRASLIGSFLLLLSYFLIENIGQMQTGSPVIDQLGNLRQVVFALDWATTIAVIAGAKIIVRFYYEEVRVQEPADRRRVLIAGTGDAAETLLREVLRMRQGRHECVGLLSGQESGLHNQHGRIHGVDIVGSINELRSICEDYAVQEVLIALPNATPRLIREMVEQCEGMGVLFRTVPPVTDLIEGRVTVSQVRDVEISDLLGRKEVQLDIDMIEAQLTKQRVLVTGAGGSIGSEMCRQVARFGPERLVLLEQAENNLFEIDRELRRAYPEIDIFPYVADIVDAERIENIFVQENPSVVFHAAAHKHVPMMEINPGEAVKNNVRGTKVVADAAVAAKVAAMVMISTDKAVNPTSVMGCSKRVAEMYVQGLSSNVQTRFVTVRFGNVLGSSGSVVPIFRQQIANGGPVTVTHPDMTRYFMTIPEASQLVLQAGAMGAGGEIYVLHMGEPVKIVDLARDMIALSGLRPGIDIEIKFSGVRPGEKLYEELMSDGEHVGDTAHPKIGIWKHRTEDWAAFQQGMQQLFDLADHSQNGMIKDKLREIVPEYAPQEFATA